MYGVTGCGENAAADVEGAEKMDMVAVQICIDFKF